MKQQSFNKMIAVFLLLGGRKQGLYIVYLVEEKKHFYFVANAQ